MNVKTVIPLALAIVLGLFAAMAAKNMIDKNKSAPAAHDKFTQVVVAKGDLPAGSALKPEDLAVGKMSGDVPADAVYSNPADVAGRVLKIAMIKGQPVMESLLAPKGTGSGLQALVPPGMRAVTIEVNEYSGVGGFLVPGCHIDILATVQGDNNEQMARTVVQNIMVTAVNTHLTAPAPGAEPEAIHSVTLLATPKEAEAIDLTAGSGRPRLILRASGDIATGFSEGVTLAELRGKAHRADPFGDNKPVDLVKPATQPADQTAAWSESRTRSIKVIRGGVESEISMQVGLRDAKWMTDSVKEQNSAADPN